MSTTANTAGPHSHPAAAGLTPDHSGTIQAAPNTHTTPAAGRPAPVQHPYPKQGTSPNSPRLPLRRLAHGNRARPAASRSYPTAVVGGVCAGLALHLRQPVARIRLLFVFATVVLWGIGALLYLLLWLLVPVGDPQAEADGVIPPARARLASRLTDTHVGDSPLGHRSSALIGGAALISAAILLGAWHGGYISGEAWLLPLLVVTTGAAVAWAQIDSVTGDKRDPAALLRLVGGVVLAAAGIVLWVGAQTPLHVLITGTMTGLALVIGIGLILAPLWLRTGRAMSQARQAEAREAERADIAAHLHDSVLQTLTLIRKQADDPETVARLARSQERELRAWLYTDRAEAGTSVAEELRDVAAQCEDMHGVPIDLVIVGERHPDTSTSALIAAAREALSNAVRHGAPPVSVYAEFTPESADIYVRDRGAGFDLEAVAPDRHGVRESIMARMDRHGGHATIRRLAQGTEVHMSLPVTS